MKRDNYQGHLNHCDFEGTEFSQEEKNEIIKDLPQAFWLIEVTLPDLYSANKSKLLDILYKSDAENNLGEENWIQIRFPGFLKKRIREGFIPLRVTSHYPLFRHEQNHEECEW